MRQSRSFCQEPLLCWRNEGQITNSFRIHTSTPSVLKHLESSFGTILLFWPDCNIFLLTDVRKSKAALIEMHSIPIHIPLLKSISNRFQCICGIWTNELSLVATFVSSFILCDHQMWLAALICVHLLLMVSHFFYVRSKRNVKSMQYTCLLLYKLKWQRRRKKKLYQFRYIERERERVRVEKSRTVQKGPSFMRSASWLYINLYNIKSAFNRNRTMLKLSQCGQW